MARYKYPAPFDQEGPPLDLLKILCAPVPPSPPLTMAPAGKPKVVPPSLYQDVVGSDPSLLYAALHADWASEDQRELAEQVAGGQKDLNRLSAADSNLLDSLLHSYNNWSEPTSEPPPFILEAGEKPKDEKLEPDDLPEPSEEITKAYD